MTTRSRHTACALVCLLAAALTTSGCSTARSLRHSTVQQAQTVADIHQQQVLNNLARFVQDPYAIPSFAHVTQGTDTLTDRGEGSLLGKIVEHGGSVLDIGGKASRQNQIAWTLTPVTDPRRLELMRCAYQRVISQCGCGFESVDCPDCRKRFNKFYTGRAFGKGLSDSVQQVPVLDENGDIVQDKDENGNLVPRMEELVVRRATRCYKCDDYGRVASLVPGNSDDREVCRRCRCADPCVDLSECPTAAPEQVSGSDETPGGPGNPNPNGAGETREPDDRFCNACRRPNSGTVNSECLYSPYGCWLRWGCKKCVPKDCMLVGQYCDIYVWVPCGVGRDELAKLTLAILDYAVNDPAKIPKKTVYAMLDKNGAPTTYKDASMLVAMQVSSDELSRSVISSDIADAERRDSEAKSADALGVKLQAMRELAAKKRSELDGLLQRTREQINADPNLDVKFKENFSTLLDLVGRPPYSKEFDVTEYVRRLPASKEKREEFYDFLSTELPNNRQSDEAFQKVFEQMSEYAAMASEVAEIEPRIRDLESSLKRLPPPPRALPPTRSRTPAPMVDPLFLQQRLNTVQ